MSSQLYFVVMHNLIEFT